jgi:hypothetical protein
MLPVVAGTSKASAADRFWPLLADEGREEPLTRGHASKGLDFLDFSNSSTLAVKLLFGAGPVLLFDDSATGSYLVSSSTSVAASSSRSRELARLSSSDWNRRVGLIDLRVSVLTFLTFFLASSLS